MALSPATHGIDADGTDADEAQAQLLSAQQLWAEEREVRASVPEGGLRARRPDVGAALQEQKQEAEEEEGKDEAHPKQGRNRLLSWHELAPWQQHGSEFIHTGYREAAASVWACIHSWTYLHNESVNILSHVAGAVLFVLLTAALVLDTWPWTRAPPASSTAGPAPMRPADRRAAMAYLAGVAVCFVLSAAFHTLLCHRSPRVAARGMALDIAGILVLMAGATVPLIHFGLACAPPAARAALHVATALLGGACAAAAGGSAGSGPPRGTGGLLRRLLASVQGPAHGHRRAALFCGFAAVSFAAPLVWMSAVAADPDWRRRVSLWPGVLLTLAGNTVGAAAYTAKFPERWWPRRFDLLGASHQIMHMAVLAAAVAYTVGVDRALTFRRSAEGAVCRNGYGG